MTIKNLFFVFLCISVCVCVSCQQETQTDSALTPVNIQKADSLIRRQAALFSEYFVAQNIEALIDIYTDDARIFPDKSEILTGDKLRDYWTPNPDWKGRTVFHKVVAEELKILGKEAYDWGHYYGKTENEDGSVSEWKGKYVIVWKEVSPDVWKMYLDIWNGI